jgi:hypothetical protein
MKRLILGAACSGLLVATAAYAQVLHSPISDRWQPAEVSRPSPLALRDAAIDVDTSLPSPGSLRLGEFTVVRLQDRVMRLRFTMMSVAPPAVPPRAPRGQALATVGVDVFMLARTSGQSPAADQSEVNAAGGAGAVGARRR